MGELWPLTVVALGGAQGCRSAIIPSAEVEETHESVGEKEETAGTHVDVRWGPTLCGFRWEFDSDAGGRGHRLRIILPQDSCLYLQENCGAQEALNLMERTHPP